MEDLLVGLLGLLRVDQFIQPIDLDPFFMQPLQPGGVIGKDAAAAERCGVIGQLPFPTAAHGEVIKEDQA